MWSGRSDGFTLIELIVTLAVVALVFTLVVPRLRQAPDLSDLRAAARDVAAVLRMARSEAISAGRPTDFLADTASGTYAIDRGSGPVGSIPQGARLTLLTAPELAAGPSGAIRFYPDGSASGGGLALMQGSLRYEVLVNWMSGAVTIKDGENVAGR